jgi:hydrogenase expression/formation protein HypE
VNTEQSSYDFTQGPACPIPLSEYPHVLLAHGGGGKLTQQLIEKMLVPQFGNEALSRLHDGAIIEISGVRLAMSTDSYVVKPVIFPGGSIGELAINGTVNDLAMCGAKPLFLSSAFILEEGFPMEALWTVVQVMQRAAERAGVLLVTGDTKVVDKGKGDGIFINTTGIGAVRAGVEIRPDRAQRGDLVIVNGPIGEHGMAIMSVREGLEFETQIRSDTVALNGLVDVMLDACPDIHVLRDPTRGGVASATNEIAKAARVGIVLEETAMPIPEEVRGACEILGFDPLYVANEGKLLAFVPPSHAQKVLTAMRSHPAGRGSTIIGTVVADHPGTVVMKTTIGGSRVVDMLSGEQLPRIC